MRFASAFAPPAPATGAKPDTASAEISTDVSYLPDLTAYLDDLLRTRERLAAAIDGVDEWARADATPAAGRDHPDPAAHQPDQGRHRPQRRRPSAPRSTRRSAVVRSTARVPLGMPSVRPALPSPANGGLRMNSSLPARLRAAPRTGAMTKGRQADSARRRQRVIAALNRAAADGAEISVSGIARAAAVDRTFLYRHRDLLEQDPRPRGRAAARRRRPGPGRHPGIPASRPARRPRACRPAERPRPAAGKTPVRGARRTGLARVRARRARRHRRPQPEDQPAGAADHRPAAPARRTRRGPDRGPGREPRAHGPAQHHGKTPVTRRARMLRNTCHSR